MFLYFALFLFTVVLIINVWLVARFIKSRGHNPPFIPSFGKLKTEILSRASDFLAQHPEAITTDLGCGSGTLLIPLAKKFPNHQFVGYEWDIVPYVLATYKTKKLPNVTILRRDFFEEDLSRYSLVLCYLGTTIEDKMGKKLNTELSKDSLVIAEISKLSVLKLKEEISVSHGPVKTKIYLYNPA